MDNAHIIVAKEALFQRLMPVFNEIHLGAIEAFSSKPALSLVLAAMAGAMIAYAFLYFLGIRMRRLPERISTDAQRERIAALGKEAKFWLPYTLILAPTPLGTVLVIAAGFFGIRWWWVALITLAAECAWRWNMLT